MHTVVLFLLNLLIVRNEAVLYRHFKENIPIEKGANLLLPSDSLICWLSIKI